MTNQLWSFVAGVFLTGVCVVTGLWANLMVTGDPLAAAELTSSVVDGTTILLMTLFIGLSGGHYIGGAFKKVSQGRWFALGSNLVLWLTVLGFIAYRASGGENVLQAATYGSILFLIAGGIFSLHKSGLVEQGSKLDEWIGHFSGKGAAIIVTASFIVRSAPDPTMAGVATVGLIVLGILLWNAYIDQIEQGVDWVEETVADLTSSDKRIEK